MKVAIVRLHQISVLSGILAISSSAQINLPAPVETNRVFISAGSVWAYRNGEQPPSAGWKELSYDHSGWTAGAAQLGYGDGDERTVTRTSAPPHPISAYFRQTFVVNSTNLPVNKIRLVRDDGAVVYINGREVLRDNMPAGPIEPSTLASATTGADGENQFREFAIGPMALLEGTNVVAVEVHQANAASSDLSFDLELIADQFQIPERPIVSIRASWPETSEPLPNALVVPGKFEVARAERDRSLPLRVHLAYEGSASAADYEPLPGAVVIPAGEASVSFNVLAKSDELVEGSETVVARIVQRNALDPAAENRPYNINLERARAEVRIADQDKPALPIVSLETLRAETPELLPNHEAIPGQFRLRRRGGLDRSLTVLLRYQGTATPETDYIKLPETVTFAANQEAVDLFVNAHGDNLVEEAETVIAHLIYPPDATLLPGYIIDSAVHSGTVRILDTTRLPVVSLRITEPASGAILHAGQPIKVAAVAIDPLGYIPRVEFFAGSTRIGVSEIAFIVPPEPGTPIHHALIWSNAPAGEHVLVARAQDSRGNAVTSPEVKVRVVDEPDRALVSVAATDPIATELPLDRNAIDAATFEISRSGSLDNELIVFFSLHGTARVLADYQAVGESVRIGIGQRSATVTILPVTDALTVVEPMETVGIRLEPSRNLGPVPWYEITPGHGEAAAVIFEREPNPNAANIAFALPDENTRFDLGQAATLLVAAYHPTQDATHVDFLLDGGKIGSSDVIVPPDQPGGLVLHRLAWRAAPTGQHQLKAVAVFESGLHMESLPLSIAIAGEPVVPIVSVRALQPDTTEPWPNADFAPGFFEFSRRGPTNEPLTLYFDVGGTATAGVDYERLGNLIVIPAGQNAVRKKVDAIDDRLPEANETVVVKLGYGPVTTEPGILPRYLIDPEQSSAELAILDNDRTNGPARIEITKPQSGQVFLLGAPVEIDAVAIDPNGYISRLEFYAGDRLIGVSEIVFIRAPDPGTPIHHSFVWKEAPAGEHVLTARAIASTGERITSNPVRIIVGSNSVPRVSFTAPRDGAVFEPGQPIFIGANGADADGRIVKMSLFAGDRLLWETNAPNLAFMWSNAPAGQHTLRVRAVDDHNTQGTGSIRVLVRESSSSFVARELPPNYVPGVAFTVTLLANPPAGTRAWGVEDQPPRGWSVTEISHRGVFDSITGKVKFGHFTEILNPQTLSYRVTPAVNAAGDYEFTGAASADGRSFAIAGDRVIRGGGAQEHHPADINRDKRMALVELTAYAAAWKTGNSSETIPLSYLTRAALIWRNGEAYRYVPASAAPACWVPEAAVFRALAASSGSAAVRSCTTQALPGDPFEVSVSVRPQPGISAYAIEEHAPAGWTATNISDEGVFDAAAGVVRWGLFLDGNARTLHYTLNAPAGLTSIADLRGAASFDGETELISGAARVVAAEGSATLAMAKCEQRADGKIELKLVGPRNQVCALEVSIDLQNWSQIEEIFLPDGELNFVGDSTAGTPQRFYRLRVR
jgi:hypothetical protein